MHTSRSEHIRGVPNETDIFNLSTTFSLPNNRYYLLTMFDSYGDGFTGRDFMLTLSTDKTTILDEALPFENYTIAFEFVLGTLPTASPTATPVPTMTMPPSMAPTVTPPTIWVVIEFDVRPDETGWRIEALHDDGETEMIKEVYAGTYIDLTNISEPVRLLPQTPKKYRFTLTDNEANGICCAYGIGSYQLWLGEPGAGELLVQGQDFVWEISHEFVINTTSLFPWSNGESTSSAGTSPTVHCGFTLVALLGTAVTLLMY